MTRGEIGGRFRLVPLHEIEVGDETPWVIRGLVPATGVIVVYGPSQAGKTFVVLDMVCHVALGALYRGRRVEQGPVVYFVAESHRGFERRCVAFRQERINGPSPPFFAIASSMSLIEDHGELITAIRDTLGDRAPAIVVIDTLNKTMKGSESRDDDMGEYYHAADAVHRALGCAVIIVHHTGWDTSHMRGHSLLPANVETSLSVRRDNAGNSVMRVEKQREGEIGLAMSNRLRAVEIGIDRNGDPITSCVVDPVETPERDAQAKRAEWKTPTGDTARALAVLERMDLPAPWDACREALDKAFAKKSDGAKRQAISGAKKELARLGIISIVDDLVSTVTVSASDAS